MAGRTTRTGRTEQHGAPAPADVFVRSSLGAEVGEAGGTSPSSPGSILVGLELQLDAHPLLQAVSTCPRDAHAAHRTCRPAALGTALAASLARAATCLSLHRPLSAPVRARVGRRRSSGGGWPEPGAEGGGLGCTR
jgi:hypothetical protein